MPRPGRAVAPRTCSSTAGWSATRRSPTRSAMPTASRRFASAARRCTCSSRCRSTRWTSTSIRPRLKCDSASSHSCTRSSAAPSVTRSVEDQHPCSRCRRACCRAHIPAARRCPSPGSWPAASIPAAGGLVRQRGRHIPHQAPHQAPGTRHLRSPQGVRPTGSALHPAPDTQHWALFLSRSVSSGTPSSSPSIMRASRSSINASSPAALNAR